MGCERLGIAVRAQRGDVAACHILIGGDVACRDLGAARIVARVAALITARVAALITVRGAVAIVRGPFVAGGLAFLARVAAALFASITFVPRIVLGCVALFARIIGGLRGLAAGLFSSSSGSRPPSSADSAASKSSLVTGCGSEGGESALSTVMEKPGRVTRFTTPPLSTVMASPKRNVARVDPFGCMLIRAMPPRMPMVDVGVFSVTGVFLLILPPTSRNTPLVALKAILPVWVSGS